MAKKQGGETTKVNMVFSFLCGGKYIVVLELKHLSMEKSCSVLKSSSSCSPMDRQDKW